MNVKALIPLIAGLCIGGFALKVGIDKLQAAKGARTASVQVWAASVDIARGAKINEQMLKPMEFPANLVPTGAFRGEDKEKLIGRVPRVDAPAGLPLLDANLMPPGELAGIMIPPGYRAVAVKIDEGSGVDFHIQPGCHVDVVGYFNVQSGEKRETVARTIIENVRVAAVGARLSSVVEEEEGKKKGRRPARAVTLLVKPDDVPKLHLVEQRGKIKLSMRNDRDEEQMGPLDPVSDGELINHPFLAATPDQGQPQDQQNEVNTQPDTPGVLDWLFGRGGSEPEPTPPEPPAMIMPAPLPPADPPWVVVVYRGDEPEMVRFKNRDSRERVDGQPEPAWAQTLPVRPSATGVSTPPSQPQPRVNRASPAPSPREPGETSHSTEQEEDQVPQEPME